MATDALWHQCQKARDPATPRPVALTKHKVALIQPLSANYTSPFHPSLILGLVQYLRYTATVFSSTARWQLSTPSTARYYYYYSV
jgi:hypothetical protein